MHVRFWHLRKRHSQCPVQQTEYLGLKQYLPAKQWALPKLPRLQLHSKNVADSICFLQPSLLAHLRVLCVCLTILALDMFLILVVGLSNGLPIVQVLFIFFYLFSIYESANLFDFAPMYCALCPCSTTIYKTSITVIGN